MRKLRIKVHTAIFTIISLFVITILFFNNYQLYQNRRQAVVDVLNKLSGEIKNKLPHSPDTNGDKDINFNPKRNNDQYANRFFLDSTVYTILLDDNYKFKEIINHTQGEIDEEKIRSMAESILNSNKNYYIGNLYIDYYSYTYDINGNLIIIDNTSIHNELIKLLISSIILLILLEIIIYMISYYLTKWITKPVEESFEKQKEFVADASHELKTPLSIIIASCDAYYLDKNEKWINNIKSESIRMTKLVTELLDLAKTEHDENYNLTHENISKILEKNILSFEGLLYERNIKLKYDIEKDIDLLCNKEQFEQLIHILLDNAVCHSEKNGKIIISLKKANKGIVLEVKNKGLPIKKEDEKNIFERFYRIDKSRNRNDNHYGLGLAIAKNIVENQNGNIEASSSDGYTTFRINWNHK